MEEREGGSGGRLMELVERWERGREGRKVDGEGGMERGRQRVEGGKEGERGREMDIHYVQYM